MVGELSLLELPEITGFYISPKKRENLYVNEMNSTGIFRIKYLVSLLNQINMKKRSMEKKTNANK